MENTQNYIDPNYLEDSGRQRSRERTQKSSLNSGRLGNIAGLLFSGALFFLPFIFIPITGWSPILGKVVVTATLGLLAGILAFGVPKTEGLNIPRTASFTGLALIALLIASLLFSDSFMSSLIGVDLEVGTFYVTVLGVILMLLAPLVLTDRKQISFSLMAFLAGGVVLALFHILRLIFGADILTFDFFFSPSSSLVGSWFDLGIYFSAIYFVALSALTFGSFSNGVKYSLTGVLALSLFFISITGLSELVLLLIISTLAFLGVSFVSQRSKNILPSAVSTIILIVALLLIKPIAGGLSERFGISYAEIKPKWENTQIMLKHGLSDPKNTAIGKGPNTYTYLWQEFRPNSAIQDDNLWLIDMPFASGLLPTFFVTFGLIVSGLMIFLAVYLAMRLFTAMRDTSADPLLASIGIASGSAAVFLWIFSFFYVFSTAPFLLMFILSGIAFASFSLSKQVVSIPLGGKGISEQLMVGGVSALVCAAMLVPVCVLAVSRTMYGQAIKMVASAEDMPTFVLAQDKIGRAAQLARNDSFARIQTSLGLFRVQEFLSREQLDERDIPEFQEIAVTTANSATGAIQFNPRNYLNYVNAGLAFETLGIIASAAENQENQADYYGQAAAHYAQAQVLNPTNPALPLMRARLEVLRDNIDGAIELAEESLAIKKNYADAHYFLSEVALGQNNISLAIERLQKGITESPNNPFLSFRLGVIHYAEKDYTQANSAFSRSIMAFPDFAYARYMRGLTRIYGDIEKDQALRDLEIASELSPDNEELLQVIANVKDDKDPFEGMDIETPDVEGAGFPESNIDAAQGFEPGDSGSLPEDTQEGQNQRSTTEPEKETDTETEE